MDKGRLSLTNTVCRDKEALEAKYLDDLHFQMECVELAQTSEKGVKLLWKRGVGIESGKATQEAGLDDKILKKTPLKKFFLVKISIT